MRNGFTLIELLAVIVILAIIALIATPIVLSIINDSKESATLRNAEYYMNAVEQSIMKKSMDTGDSYSPSKCIIQEDGNLLCDDTDKVTVEVKGNKPTSGTITFDKGKMDSITLIIADRTILTDDKDKQMYIAKYRLGQELTFNPGDGDRTWNVVDEDITTVTLMLTENLGNTVAWYAYSNQNSFDNSYGPMDALKYLNTLTKNWDNVDPIENYIYINNLDGTAKPKGYQKLEIKDGKTTLTHKNGISIIEIEETTKARLLALDEVFEIASKTNTNLTEENLRLFILDNLETLNDLLNSQGNEITLETVDEVISLVIQMEGYEWLQYESKYMQTYYTVFVMKNTYKIVPTHNILLPRYLYQNLHTEDNKSLPYGYWTLSSRADYSYYAWIVEYVGSVYHHYVNQDINYGVRPVIRVLKSKL